MTKKADQRNMFSMVVKVSVPAGLNAEEARAEVRSLIKHQCSVLVDEHEISLLSVKPCPRPPIGPNRPVQLIAQDLPISVDANDPV